MTVTKTLDAKGLIAHLTGTDPKTWEPFMGRKEGVGEEQWFTEVGDFGPYDEDVADMIRDGYTSGRNWSLDTEIDFSEDEDAAYEIARLIAGGNTSGYNPTWSVEMHKTMPGEAYVQIDEGFVTVKMEKTRNHEEIDFVSPIDDLANSPDTASLVKDADQPMKM
jgi:hypothetical protein